jgi:hypothetical protein
MAWEIPKSGAINVDEVVDASRVGGLQVRVRAFVLAVAAALVDGYDTQVAVALSPCDASSGQKGSPE